MHREHVLLPSREPVFACECLLFFRCPSLRLRGFRIRTRASGATSFIISSAVIWCTVLFRQNRTDRPYGGKNVVTPPPVRLCFAYRTVLGIRRADHWLVILEDSQIYGSTMTVYPPTS